MTISYKVSLVECRNFLPFHGVTCMKLARCISHEIAIKICFHTVMAPPIHLGAWSMVIIFIQLDVKKALLPFHRSTTFTVALFPRFWQNAFLPFGHFHSDPQLRNSRCSQKEVAAGNFVAESDGSFCVLLMP